MPTSPHPDPILPELIRLGEGRIGCHFPRRQRTNQMSQCLDSAPACRPKRERRKIKPWPSPKRLTLPSARESGGCQGPRGGARGPDLAPGSWPASPLGAGHPSGPLADVFPGAQREGCWRSLHLGSGLSCDRSLTPFLLVAVDGLCPPTLPSLLQAAGCGLGCQIPVDDPKPTASPFQASVSPPKPVLPRE